MKDSSIFFPSLEQMGLMLVSVCVCTCAFMSKTFYDVTLLTYYLVRLIFRPWSQLLSKINKEDDDMNQSTSVQQNSREKLV